MSCRLLFFINVKRDCMLGISVFRVWGIYVHGSWKEGRRVNHENERKSQRTLFPFYSTRILLSVCPHRRAWRNADRIGNREREGGIQNSPSKDCHLSGLIVIAWLEGTGRKREPTSRRVLSLLLFPTRFCLNFAWARKVFYGMPPLHL